ncbi:InlB B-repeat-containing protein, partial [Flammeovirga agarivorans]
RVSTDEDDAEEAEDGSIDLSSSDLELVYDPHEAAGNQSVGIRFQALDIPKGAIITEAYIQFTADEDKNNEGSMNIYAQDVNSAAAFSSIVNDISSRAKTNASVAWTPTTWSTIGEAGDAQKTPNLSALVQEVIDRDGWTSGNNMAFIIEGTGRRVAESYKGSSTAAPQLIVEYKNIYSLSLAATNGTITSSVPNQNSIEEGQEVTLTANPASGYEFSGWSGDITSNENPVTVLMDQNKNITANFTEQPSGTTITVSVIKGNDDAEEAESGLVSTSSTDLELVYDDLENAGNQMVGIRFRDINIPQGATITNAFIQFTAAENKNDNGSLTIHAQFANRPSTFTTNTNDISLRPKTTASVAWTPAAWNTVGEAGSAQRTPDLKNIVQEIVNRSGWAQGHLVFIIQGTGRRVAKAYTNSSPADAPKLTITYEDNGSSSRTMSTESVFGGSYDEINQFKVYPNPITDIVNLEFEASTSEQIGITFYDILGKVVLTTNAVTNSGRNKIEIKTSSLLPGKYTVRIVGQNLQKTVNLVK